MTDSGSTRSEHLEAAIGASRAAAGVIRRHYAQFRADRASLKVEVKKDRTPVTRADREAEEAIEAYLTSRFPNYGFHGEEGGTKGEGASHKWLVDPIDGTKSFLRGLTRFVSTQIALVRDGEFLLGVSAAPLADEFACAEVGRGAEVDGLVVRVSDVATIEEAAISFSNVRTLASGSRWEKLATLVQRGYHVRGFGDYYAYHRLAAGEIDVVIESDVSILDVAALVSIVREAGGRVTDLDGGEIGLSSRNIIATNGRLHDAVVRALA